MGVSVTVDLSGVRQKLSPQAQARGKYNMASRMLSTMNENFVPMEQGNLRAFSHVDQGGDALTWNMPYAKPQYYAPGGWNYTTPGTGPYWDKKAKGVFMNDWTLAYLKGAGIR